MYLILTAMLLTTCIASASKFKFIYLPLNINYNSGFDRISRVDHFDLTTLMRPYEDSLVRSLEGRVPSHVFCRDDVRVHFTDRRGKTYKLDWKLNLLVDGTTYSLRDRGHAFLQLLSANTPASSDVDGVSSFKLPAGLHGTRLAWDEAYVRLRKQGDDAHLFDLSSALKFKQRDLSLLLQLSVPDLSLPGDFQPSRTTFLELRDRGRIVLQAFADGTLRYEGKLYRLTDIGHKYLSFTVSQSLPIPIPTEPPAPESSAILPMSCGLA